MFSAMYGKRLPHDSLAQIVVDVVLDGAAGGYLYENQGVVRVPCRWSGRFVFLVSVWFSPW